MNRTQEHSSKGSRAVGISIALGAVLGAVVGAGVGAALGDVGQWTGFGIPIGISVALAVGPLFWKPTRVASPTSWAMEDDAIPLEPPARTQETPPPTRSTTEAA